MQPHENDETGMGKAFRKAGYVSPKEKVIKAFNAGLEAFLTRQLVDLYAYGVTPKQAFDLLQARFRAVHQAYCAAQTTTVAVSGHERSAPNTKLPSPEKSKKKPYRGKDTLTLASAAKAADFERVPECFFLSTGVRVDLMTIKQARTLLQHNDTDIALKTKDNIVLRRLLSAQQYADENMTFAECYMNKTKITKIIEDKN